MTSSEDTEFSGPLSDLKKVSELALLEAALADTDYVQHFQLRRIGSPIPKYGKQTHKKLDAIIKSFDISFTGKSFIDLGCNKGFFPLYVAGMGAYRTVGIDPTPALVDAANRIATLTSVPATFYTTRFHLSLAAEIGIFDISYVGSAYHYFWNDYKDHRKVFAALSDLTAEVLLFEGPLNLDDRAWRDAAMRLTGEPEEVIRLQYNDDLILTAASEFFDITYKGGSGHANERFLYEMKKRKRAVTRPTMPVTQSGSEQLLEAKVGSVTEVGRPPEGIYVIEASGRRMIKKRLRLSREWCIAAIARFETYFENRTRPAALCNHYGSAQENGDLILFQDYIEGASNLVRHGGISDKVVRQRLLHSVCRMQIDLLHAGLLHTDIFMSNILLCKGEVFVVDYEGLILFDGSDYRTKFINFYTLNILSFLNQIIFQDGVGREELVSIEGIQLAGPGFDKDQARNIIERLSPVNPVLRAICSEVLANPKVLTSIAFYEYLLSIVPLQLP